MKGVVSMRRADHHTRFCISTCGAFRGSMEISPLTSLETPRRTPIRNHLVIPIDPIGSEGDADFETPVCDKPSGAT